MSFNSSSVTTSPAVDYTPSKSHKALKGTAGNISCCCSTRRLFLISRVDQQLIELFLTLVREQCEQKAALGTASAYRCTWESRHNKSRAAGSALCGADRSAGVCARADAYREITKENTHTRRINHLHAHARVRYGKWLCASAGLCEHV